MVEKPVWTWVDIRLHMRVVAAPLLFSIGPCTSCGSRAASEHVIRPPLVLKRAAASVFYLTFGVLNVQE